MQRSKLLAYLLVVSVLCGTGTPWHADDQADHGLDSVAHHTGKHDLITPSAAGPPQHCAVCHLLQSLRTVVLVRVRAFQDASLRVTVGHDALAHAGSSTLFHLPSRAPPA